MSATTPVSGKIGLGSRIVRLVALQEKLKNLPLGDFKVDEFGFVMIINGWSPKNGSHMYISDEELGEFEKRVETLVLMDERRRVMHARVSKPH